MACLIASGAVKTCEFSTGGLKALYLYNFDEVASWTLTSGVYSAFTMVTDAVGFKFEFPKDTASFNAELVVSNGQKYVNHTVIFNIDGKSKVAAGSGAQTDAEADSLVVLQEALALGKYVAIAEDRNGKRYILGRQNGIEATSLVRGSGAAEGDFSGAVITLAGAQTEYAQIYAGDGDLNLT